jgi:hypothetical protein
MTIPIGTLTLVYLRPNENLNWLLFPFLAQGLYRHEIYHVESMPETYAAILQPSYLIDWPQSGLCRLSRKSVFMIVWANPPRVENFRNLLAMLKSSQVYEILIIVT